MTGDARNGDCKVELSGPSRSIWLSEAIIMSSDAGPKLVSIGRLDGPEGEGALTKDEEGARANA